MTTNPNTDPMTADQFQEWFGQHQPARTERYEILAWPYEERPITTYGILDTETDTVVENFDNREAAYARLDALNTTA